MFDIYLNDDQNQREFKSQCELNNQIASETDVANLGFNDGFKDITPNSYNWSKLAYRESYLEGIRHRYHTLFAYLDLDNNPF